MGKRVKIEQNGKEVEVIVRSTAEQWKMYETYSKLYDKAAAKEERMGYEMYRSKMDFENYRTVLNQYDAEVISGGYRQDTSHLNRDIVAEQSKPMREKTVRAIYKELVEEYFPDRKKPGGEKPDFTLQDIRHMGHGKGENNILTNYLSETYEAWKKQKIASGEIVNTKEWSDMVKVMMGGSPK